MSTESLRTGAAPAPLGWESPALGPWGWRVTPANPHRGERSVQSSIHPPSPSCPGNASAAAHAVFRGVESRLQGLQVPGVHPPQVAGSLLQRLVAHVALQTDVPLGAGSTHTPCPRSPLHWTFSFPLLCVS